MKRKLITIGIFCLMCFSLISIATLGIIGEKEKTDEPLFVVKIIFKNQTELELLQNTDINIEEIGETYVMAVLTFDQFDYLRKQGFEMEILSIKEEIKEVMPPSWKIPQQEVPESRPVPGVSEVRASSYQRLDGNKYYDYFGDVNPSAIYENGVVLSQGDYDGWVKYRFFYPHDACFLKADIGIFGKDTDTAVNGNGVAIFIYNWVSLNWEYFGNTAEDESLYLWGLCTDTHISPTYKNLIVQVFADLHDCFHIDYLDTYCNYETPEWTVMVYSNGDNDLDEALVDDLNEMEYAGSKISYPGINIVAQIDRSKNGDWTTTRRYYICKDKNGYDGTMRSTMITDKGELNMGDPNTLIDFVSWAQCMYPAKRYMLIIADHGSGWRGKDSPFQAIKGVSYDETDKDGITMPELRQALNIITNGGSNKLDIIGFDACLMATVEVDYDIRLYGDYRIASQETAPNDGWDYESSFSALVNNPTISPNDLASQIVNDFINFYNSHGIYDVTLSAVKLSEVPNLISAISTLGRDLKSNIRVYKSQLKFIKDSVEHYDTNRDGIGDQDDHSVDLYHFCELARWYINDPVIQNDAFNVMSMLSNAVIANRSGIYRPRAYGASIYFIDKRYNIYHANYEKVILFSTDTQWDEFLRAYFSPLFGDLHSLLAFNNFHVVGDGAYCTDVLGTANMSWIFGYNHMDRPEGRTDVILRQFEHDTGNLLICGGPAVNPVATEFGQQFGINYIDIPGVRFEIQCEGKSISLDLCNYPQKDIAIVYLGSENERTILMVWGYGWEGTYAATVLMSHPNAWSAYENEHFLFVQWEDLNSDNLVTWPEIQVVYPDNVSMSAPPSGSWTLNPPVFANLPTLFGSNNFHVVGDGAYCTDVLGTANMSWIFGYNHMDRPEGRTDVILRQFEHDTGNLLICGGPAVNPVATEFGQQFGINYIDIPGVRFEIQCEGKSISLDLSDHPPYDIAIVYLGQQNNRNVLIIWGYGWYGTYAGTMVMTDPTFLNDYSGCHLLLLRWYDENFDAIVQMSEISVEISA